MNKRKVRRPAGVKRSPQLLSFFFLLVVAVLGLNSCGTGLEQLVTPTTAAQLPSDSETAVTIAEGWEVFYSPAGDEILVKGSSADTLDLTYWAFSRFGFAGLDEPVVTWIDFEPADDTCVGLSGWTIGNSHTGVSICIPEERLCRKANGTTDTTTIGRFCLLHELSHAWMIDHVDGDLRLEFQNWLRLEVWNHPDTVWKERAVEHAAESVAWGLMDQTLVLYRLDHPPCEDVAHAFRMLTGVEPLVECEIVLDKATGGGAR